MWYFCSRNSIAGFAHVNISSNQEDGICVDKKSILDFSSDDNYGTPTIISDNSESGIRAANNVFIDFDDDVDLRINGNSQSINLGHDTEMDVEEAELTIDSPINCWSNYAVDPSDSNITQSSDFPVIKFDYSDNLPEISSNCRIILPNN